ncbi:hypothetical protein FQR65_LT06398 [Abscondita terminalis]|nr:hypothetical protein FQR65_LT06398 [Abscondita terminalis]
MISFATIVFFGLLCGSLSSNSLSNDIKLGQCPYILTYPDNCNFKCKSDSSCHGTEICCSNGCGTQCMQPLNYTMCQHQHIVAQHHLERGSTSNKYVPECKDDGSYKEKQCNSNECWCVDFRGFEISQTRTLISNTLECSEKDNIRNCPLYKCKKDCEHGFKLDENGCRTCGCVDPCDSIECFEENKSCRLLNVQCTQWPCPPVPMCLPSPNNPCIKGEPLKSDNGILHCNDEELCPFTHMCRTSVFSTKGSCCRQIGKCLPFKCNLSCQHGYAIDDYECPVCKCHEPCKEVLCPPSTFCKVVQVQCFRAPCLPIAQCE